MNVCKLLKYYTLNFRCLAPSFNITYTQAGRLFSLARTILPENVVVTHEITCQGRDHMVKIRSGESVVVIQRAL